MEAIINSGIKLVASFPMSARDPKFVMVVANHFDPYSISVKDESGKKLIRLAEKFFDESSSVPVLRSIPILQ